MSVSGETLEKDMKEAVTSISTSTTFSNNSQKKKNRKAKMKMLQQAPTSELKVPNVQLKCLKVSKGEHLTLLQNFFKDYKAENIKFIGPDITCFGAP